MSRQAQPFHLTDEEIAYLKEYVNKGKRPARAIKRAQILLHSHAGKSPEQICEIMDTSVATIYLTRQHSRQEGVQAAIEEKPRPGQPRRLSSEQEAALTVLACSAAPEGHAQWSVRLLTDKVIEIGIADRVGRETIRRFLKKMHSNPG
jgi:transposase